MRTSRLAAVFSGLATVALAATACGSAPESGTESGAEGGTQSEGAAPTGDASDFKA